MMPPTFGREHSLNVAATPRDVPAPSLSAALLAALPFQSPERCLCIARTDVYQGAWEAMERHVPPER